MRAFGDRFPAIAIVAALVLAGFWFGRSTAPAPQLGVGEPSAAAQHDERTSPGRARVVRVAGGPSIEEISAEIRAAVRDELDRNQSAQPRGRDPEEAASEPNLEQQDVLEHGHALLDGVIDAGQFSADDHREIDDLLAQLPSAHKQELLSRLFVAINDQQVVPELP